MTGVLGIYSSFDELAVPSSLRREDWHDMLLVFGPSNAWYVVNSILAAGVPKCHGCSAGTAA